MKSDLTAELTAYLNSWYETAKAKQTKRGVAFHLSFDEFLELWGTRRLRTMQKHMDDGTIYKRMNGENPFAFVFTWKNYRAKQQGVMCRETAQVCTRQKSRMDCSMKKGDEHTPSAKAKIAAKKLGIPRDDDTKAKISKSMKGKNRKPMSEEQKLVRKLAAQASWAERKAAKGGAA